MARKPVERLNYERTTNQASYYRESLRRKAIKAIPVIGGGLALAGPVLSAEIFDPAAFTIIGDSSTVNDCSTDYSSIISRDPLNNCAYKTELNTDLYKKFSEANDSELEAYFQDHGVCALIHDNYFKFYPKLNSQNVSCGVNKPVTLNYEDGLQLAVDSNTITITKKQRDLKIETLPAKLNFN